MINQTSQVTRVVREVEEHIPNENNHVTRDSRFSDTKGSLQNLEKELASHPTTTRSGYDRPFGQPASTSVGYAQTPIGHGTHPVNPTSPVKLREVERNIPATSGFATGTTVPLQGQAHPISAVSEIKTVPRTVNLENIEASEIRHHDASRQVESPNQLSRWEAQQADVSYMRYENHQVFENWEANRSSFVQDRLNVMDDLIAGMDKKLDWLEQGVHKVIQFFKERELQEEKYSKLARNHLPQLGEHFEKVDDPVLFGNFSRGMKESDAFHAQDTKNSEILGNFIKKDIIDWILIPNENSYKLQSKTLKNPMRDFRRKLDYAASNRNKSYQKYFKNYDHLQKSSKLTPEENRIFQRQLKYSLAAREELRLLKLYNEHGLMVINEYTRLATVRMNEIQKAFSLYLQKYLELYSNTAITPEPILELIEGSNGAEAVQSLFLPKNLLTYNNQEFLKRQFNKDEICYNDIQAFLVNFPDSIDPARSAFITREWDAVKVGGFFHRTRPCMILATNTNNLLVVEKKFEDSETGKVKEPFQLRFTTVDKVSASKDGSGTIVSVVERTPGSVFHHNAKAKLKFETPQEAQSFLDYLGTKAQVGFEGHNAVAGNFVTSQMVGGSQLQHGSHLNTSGMPTMGVVQDPILRSLGGQVQAGQIVSQHVISSRPILTQADTAVQHHVPITQSVITSQPITQTILRSEPIVSQPITQTILKTEPILTQPVAQTIREPVVSHISSTSTNVRTITQQMTDI